jgi:hypothetical protein
VSDGLFVVISYINQNEGCGDCCRRANEYFSRQVKPPSYQEDAMATFRSDDQSRWKQITWYRCAVILASALGAFGNPAAAEPIPISDPLAISDTLSALVAGGTSLRVSLTEQDELRGLSAVLRIGGTSVDFATPGYGVSDNVTFGSFVVTLTSDPIILASAFDGVGIERTVTGERAATWGTLPTSSSSVLTLPTVLWAAPDPRRCHASASRRSATVRRGSHTMRL